MVLLSGIRIASSIRQPGVLQGSLFYLTTTTQSLHTSGVIYKKKQNSEGEDAFAIEDDDELFAIPADTRPQNNTSLSVSQTEKLAANRAKYFQQSKNKLLENPAFRAYYLWREQSSGKNSGSPIANETIGDKHAKAKDPPRRAILSCMITHASTRAELLQIVDVFSIYRAKQWSIDDLNRIDFIGRCINLKSPDIALAVLHHRPQFGIDIPSLSTGRALLHSLVITPYPPVNDPLPEHLALPTSTPFDHALLMANLFSLYALPPAESDEVARALLLGACAEQKGENLEIESVGAVMRKVREWIETQKTAEDAKAEGVILPTQGTLEGVKDGKLVMSAKAIKEGGKASIRKVTEVIPSDNNKLSIPERQWIKHGLERFVNWAQEKGEDVAWVEKLKVQEA